MQHDGQNRLANEIDGLIGLKSRPRRLIQVGAEKYASQPLARVELPGRIDPDYRELLNGLCTTETAAEPGSSMPPLQHEQ